MSALQAIAMGLVVVALRAGFGGYDALPDPLGWLLVLHGVRRLPEDLVRRHALLLLAVLALLVSVPLWLPEVADRLYDLHPSLGWAANLPQLGFVAVLTDALARRAFAHRDRKASGWLRTALVLVAVSALLPVLVFGGGLASLEVASYVLATLTLLMVIWLLFSYAGRPWSTGSESQVDWTGP